MLRADLTSCPTSIRRLPSKRYQANYVGPDLVRHNAPPAAWPAGISAFTIVFAAGQIVGPTLVGWVADGSGGLTRGLACSAAILLLGALAAWGQRPLNPPSAPA